MKTKKVVLFIVEGITDKTALGAILSKLVQNNKVKFYRCNKDITSDNGSNASNAKIKVNECVKYFMNKEIGIRKNDICKIVHLIDMDGAYITEERVITGNEEKFIYSEHCITAKSKEAVLSRNRTKSEVINTLAFCPTINNIQYRMYYFSCNLEHVLHNELNVPDCDKMILAERFSEDYHLKEDLFMDFIRRTDIAVLGDYKDSWKFIKVNGNSLKRCSNFHLFFNE